MRALVVGNNTLATMYAQKWHFIMSAFLRAADDLQHISCPFFSAVQYKLPDRLRLQRAQSVTLKASPHVQGTLRMGCGETPSHLTNFIHILPITPYNHTRYPNPSIHLHPPC
jgi:hypothetical protein